MKRVKRGKPPAKMGRPAHIPKKKYRVAVKTLATVGFSAQEICNYLDDKWDVRISDETLRKTYRRQLSTGLPELLGLAKRGLRAALAKGAPWAVCFTLKTRGKQFGWMERSEITGKDGLPLFDLSKLNDEELEQFRELRTKAIEDAKKG